MYRIRLINLPAILMMTALLACGGNNTDPAVSSSQPQTLLEGFADDSTPSNNAALISVDPDGLKQGQHQYLMATIMPNDETFSSKWSVKPSSCGTFSNNGEYQNTRFALLDVPAAASEACEVSVTIDGTATATHRFTAPQPTADITFSYRSADETKNRGFALHQHSASYTVPARYYDSSGKTQTASSLQLTADWHCVPSCADQQIAFAGTEQTVTLYKGDTSINLKLLASNSSTTAILSRADLEYIDDSNENLNGNYYQLATIDLGGVLHQTSDNSNLWTMIGRNTAAFTGSYDGQSLPIRNLRIHSPNENNIGLFGYTSGSTIENIALQGLDLRANDKVGGLVGYSHSGDISDSYARGFVSGNNWVGGLVGDNDSGDISNSYASSTVSGDQWVGGLVGDNDSGDISNSYASSTVSGDQWVGGLVGDNGANINSSYANGTVHGTRNVGGLVGINSSIHSNISNSYATGKLSGIADLNYSIGGLVGRNLGSINNSYTTAGAVSGFAWIGGLVGVNENDSNIHNSYAATGTVSGSSNHKVGGLVGFNYDGGSISASYWDTTSSGQPDSEDGTGNTTDEMQKESSYSGWAFGTRWNISSTANSGYPYLLCVAGQTGYVPQASDCAPGNPTISIADGQPDILYPGSTRTLLSNPDNAAAQDLLYQWQVMRDGKDVTDDMLSAVQGEPSKILFTATDDRGHYLISVTIRNAYGESTEEYTLTVPALKAVITTNSETEWSATTSSGIGLSYQWRLERFPSYASELLRHEKDRSTLAYTPDQNGKYYLKLTITDAIGDSDSAYHAFNNGTVENENPIAYDIVSADPAGLQKGQAQYLMVLAHDPDDSDIFFTEWSVKPASCGSFADEGKYQDSIFAPLDVPANASEDCTVSVTISDGYGGSATVEKIFTAPRPITESVQLSYDSETDNVFALPLQQDASYTVPSRYYDEDGTLQTAISLYIPRGWNCDSSRCEQITFGNSPREVLLSKEGSSTTITLSLLTNDNPAKAILRRADLEYIDDVDENMAGDYYQLNAIDLGGILHRPGNNNHHWTAIGTPTDSSPFTGSYNGQQLPLRNLRIQQLEQSFLGMFGYTKDATIQNVSLQAVDVRGNRKLGGLVGINIGGSISNSYSRGNVYGISDGYTRGLFFFRNKEIPRRSPQDGIGGLVGINSGSIDNSHTSGTVTADHSIGGLVGLNKGSINNSHARNATLGNNNIGGLVGKNNNELFLYIGDSTDWTSGTGRISNSHASGHVAGKKDHVGGLVGDLRGGKIDNSYADGKVSGNRSVGGLIGYSSRIRIASSHASGDVTGTLHVGGLVGENLKGTINASYATGKVSGNEDVGGLIGNNNGNINRSHASGRIVGSLYVGGLIGHNGGSVSNSYAISDEVTGKNYVGGLIGVSNTGDISNSYASGKVSGDIHFGGLLGFIYDYISNSYWDTETTGQEHSAGSDDSEGKTTAEMRMQATYSGWEFASIWDIDTDSDASERSNGGYPYLLCVGGQSGYAAQEDDCTAE